MGTLGCGGVAGETENRQPLQFLFQLPNPLLQELPLRFLLGERQSFLMRGPGLGGPAEPAVHIRAGRMRQVVICQFAMCQHRVDMRQTGLWTIAHGNCHGTIQLYHWRRLNSYQLVVKRDNLSPVGRSDRFRLRMNGRNRSRDCTKALRATDLSAILGKIAQPQAHSPQALQGATFRSAKGTEWR